MRKRFPEKRVQIRENGACNPAREVVE
jgi:hypothetical protein